MHLIIQKMKMTYLERKVGKKQQPENSKFMAALEAVKSELSKFSQRSDEQQSQNTPYHRGQTKGPKKPFTECKNM